MSDHISVSEYDAFVQRTDQSDDLPPEERLDVAFYGVAAEVGSVISAIKKRLLRHAGASAWNTPDPEVVEELGDVLWYCFLLARLTNPTRPTNIFIHDIEVLTKEVGAGDPRAERIRTALDPDKRAQFLTAAAAFPQVSDMTLDSYQELAFLTARTSERTLAEVCLVVLQQLSAQLLRAKLPQIERELNLALVDREVDDILGEIFWHIAALASLFQLKLGEIARANMRKVLDRWGTSTTTELHDRNFPLSEQLPRSFKVTFLTIAKGRSRMYVGTAQLGNELTDNAYDDDGYRFHDVMHLANAAKLGWSPVLRDLLDRKRRSKLAVDEVEDGARAKIVEEAVIKAIHAEGVRLSRLREPPGSTTPVRLFSEPADISFSLLKMIRALVVGLEVERNTFSEWEAAIREGYALFHQLRLHGKGTVVVDLEKRSLTFDPSVDGFPKRSES